MQAIYARFELVDHLLLSFKLRLQFSILFDQFTQLGVDACIR